jgi:urea transporter
MTHVDELKSTGAESLARNIPAPVLWTFRGIGQVFFQENALTGALFALGIAVSSPLMALGGIVGAVIGTATAWLLKYDKSEIHAGIYGFNATLVGIATLFFFRPGAASITLLVVGCVVATLLTWLARKNLPFPTYTAPFIVTTWVVHALGKAMGAAPVVGYPALLSNPPLPFAAEAVAHGIGQVMFQGSLWTGLLFLVGIAINDRQHAAWVLAGSIVGMLLAWHHTTEATRAIDPERLVDRALFDNIALGLYGYNATLAAVALFLWRRSVIPPLLGMLLSVPLTELVPLLGLPALTAPFVLATWLVLALGWLDERLFREKVGAVP